MRGLVANETGWAARCVYVFAQAAARGYGQAWHRVRYFDVPDLRRFPGGMLIASNHQSYLDPMFIGGRLKEPISFLARSTLFDVPGFGRLIWTLRARPVKRGEIDTEALKTMIRVLRGGGKLLMFPEGTRTPDGELGVFKTGAAAIAIRCRVPVLPVCVEGAFDCWPRTQALPRTGRIAMKFGGPIRSAGLDADELTARMRAEIGRMQEDLRGFLQTMR
jgi:1-acyl-sn-glycerol-3-phosphate acyltransferase